jgi:hypothetical protein
VINVLQKQLTFCCDIKLVVDAVAVIFGRTRRDAKFFGDHGIGMPSDNVLHQLALPCAEFRRHFFGGKRLRLPVLCRGLRGAAKTLGPALAVELMKCGENLEPVLRAE